MAPVDSSLSARVPGRSGVLAAGGWRLAAIGGVVGPAAFIGAWIVGSATKPGYSAVDDAISRLAADGADTQTLMTAGFVAFGIGVPIYAAALRRALGGLAYVTAAATGLATLGIAALPLERSPGVDTWHGAVAGVAYLTLALTPLLARRPLRTNGHRRLAALSGAVAAVTAASLALSLTGLPTGLFQRIGLTTGDVWIMVSAAAILLARPGPTTT